MDKEQKRLYTEEHYYGGRSRSNSDSDSEPEFDYGSPEWSNTEPDFDGFDTNTDSGSDSDFDPPPEVQALAQANLEIESLRRQVATLLAERETGTLWNQINAIRKDVRELPPITDDDLLRCINGMRSHRGLSPRMTHVITKDTSAVCAITFETVVNILDTQEDLVDHTETMAEISEYRDVLGLPRLSESSILAVINSLRVKANTPPLDTLNKAPRVAVTTVAHYINIFGETLKERDSAIAVLNSISNILHT